MTPRTRGPRCQPGEMVGDNKDRGIWCQPGAMVGDSKDKGPMMSPGEMGGVHLQGVPFSCTCGHLHSSNPASRRLRVMNS